MLRPTEHQVTAPAVVAPSSDTNRDPWLGEDKLRHFSMSFATTAFAYAAARPALDPGHARFAAGSAAIAAGIGKEIHDARAGRWFSLRDMAWNLAGVATGLTLIRQTR
jgi:uncharacterized protein YfiM (DUF2279 family)